MPRFGFETLYAPPQLDHCASWEGRQFVAHFANQRNSGVLTILISAFPFYNTTWSLTLTLMLLFTCWTHPKIFIQCWLIFCDVWTLGISTMEPLIMWIILSTDIYWVQHSSTSRRGVAFKQRQTVNCQKSHKHDEWRNLWYESGWRTY